MPHKDPKKALQWRMSRKKERKDIMKKFKSKHPGYFRDKQLQRDYGITLIAYEAMLQDQGGGCAVCGRRPGTRSLHVDHNHETGQVRGLLCSQCNHALGLLSEDVLRIMELAEYLKGHNGTRDI